MSVRCDTAAVGLFSLAWDTCSVCEMCRPDTEDTEERTFSKINRPIHGCLRSPGLFHDLEPETPG
jgi:hypothetical protein